jgi:quinol monooxygenase YgiN
MQMSDVGIMFTFRVATSEDGNAEALLRQIYDAMKEEFQSGAVKTFAAYRDPPNPGKWYVFQSLTKDAAERNFTNIGKWKMLEDYSTPGDVPAKVKAPAEKLAALMAERPWRHLLEPVSVHGCGELVPNATLRKPDSATDVGAFYTYRVAPKDDAAMEKSMLSLIEVMKTDEYPTNDVMSYTLYRNTLEPGAWAMYEHFTQEGAATHATTPGIYLLGHEQLDMMIAPYERYVLDPVIVKGCGEPIS